MELDDLDIDMGNDFQDNVNSKDPVRRVMNLYYLVDTSGSMHGSKIESINQVMPEIVEMVRDISDSNADAAEIKVNCLCFSTGARWMYSQPLKADEFQWLPCTAGGLTDLGRAYTELEKHLHRDSDLGNGQGHFTPGIILLTDGYPTDDHKSGLEALKKNAWFKHAIKVAIAIEPPRTSGSDEIYKMLPPLRDFVGEGAEKEAIYRVEDVDGLKEVIKLVSCAVSKIGSSNPSTDQTTRSEQLNDEIQGGLGENINNNSTTTDTGGGIVIDVPPMGDDIFD